MITNSVKAPSRPFSNFVSSTLLAKINSITHDKSTHQDRNRETLNKRHFNKAHQQINKGELNFFEPSLAVIQ
jgi:hypothetical protein